MSNWMEGEWTEVGPGHISKAIDPEGDVYVDVLEVDDYNGDPVATVLCTGHPVMTIYPDTDHGPEHEFLTPCGYFTQQAQSMVAFQTHVEGVDEDDVQEWMADVGEEEGYRRFTKVFEGGGDGHETCAFVEQVSIILNALRVKQRKEVTNGSDNDKRG